MRFAHALALAFAWCVLTREASPSNAALGLVLGAALAATFGARRPTPLPGRGRVAARSSAAGAWRRALARPWRGLELAAFFLLELVVSSIRVAALLFRPRLALRPAILAVPVAVESEEELALLSDLVSLTPGTLTLDASADGRTLYVHVMVADDLDAVRREIREGLARRVRRLYA